MAKCYLPLMSTAASGRFAGLEYKRLPIGNVTGRKSTCTPASSLLQQQSRVTLGRLAHRWAQMDDESRAPWETSAHGHLTGYSLWLKRSYWVYRASGQPALDPDWLPDPYPKTETVALWITGDPSALYVSPDPWPDPGPLAVLQVQPLRYASARPDHTHWELAYLGSAYLLQQPIEYPSSTPPLRTRLRIIDMVSGLTIYESTPDTVVI